MAKQHDKQFKLDAVQYYEDHKDLGVRGCVENLGIDTIRKAKARRNIDHPLIIHSYRGSQYVAKEYKKATENMQRSYSKKAIPWDNACIGYSCAMKSHKNIHTTSSIESVNSRFRKVTKND